MGRTFARALAANVSLTIGVIGGIKAADYLMWDEHKYAVMKEQIELDYWKKYGKPEHIEGNLHKSATKDGEFFVTYLNEKKSTRFNGEAKSIDSAYWTNLFEFLWAEANPCFAAD